MKKVISFFTFVLIIGLLTNECNRLFALKDFHENDFSGSLHESFYADGIQVDAMFFGPSTTLHGISPLEIYKEYGITSWNWGMPHQRSVINYHYIKEAISYSKPKVIFYDVYGLFGSADSFLGNYTIQFSLYPMHSGKVKISAVADVYRLRQEYAEELNLQDADSIIQFLFPLYQFHNRAGELEQKDFLGSEYNFREEYDGSRLAAFTLGGGVSRLYSAEGVNEIPPDLEDTSEQLVEFHPLSLEYFDSIVELCEEEDISLILYNTTMGGMEWNKGFHLAVQNLADNYDLPYYDLTMLQDEIGFDYTTDMVDVHHQNILGSAKTSRYLGGILRELLGRESVMDEDEKMLWDMALQEYQLKYQETTK